MKELRFPQKAFRQEKSIRVFVYFSLTSEGQFDEVAIANSSPIDESFKEELNYFWRKLPRQNPKYAGLYVIPICFLFGDKGPNKLKPIANETDTIVAKPGYKILSELPIISYIICEKKVFTD